jgi:hypothetical protein
VPSSKIWVGLKDDWMVGLAGRGDGGKADGPSWGRGSRRGAVMAGVGDGPCGFSSGVRRGDVEVVLEGGCPGVASTVAGYGPKFPSCRPRWRGWLSVAGETGRRRHKYMAGFPAFVENQRPRDQSPTAGHLSPTTTSAPQRQVWRQFDPTKRPTSASTQLSFSSSSSATAAIYPPSSSAFRHFSRPPGTCFDGCAHRTFPSQPCCRPAHTKKSAMVGPCSR